MKRWNVCVILSIWGIIGFPGTQQSVSAATLHVILAGDTQDEYIGPAVSLDLEEFRQELQVIAEATGMLVRRVEFTGSGLRKRPLMDAVGGLRPAPDDAVLFYFSGHGFSLQSKDRWPYMAFLDDEALDAKWVFDQLLATGPRLLLVLSDSCNNVIPDAYAPDVSLGRQLKRSLGSQENYRTLFLEARGAILASSSRHNEYSSTLKNGSAFTRQFFSALRSAVAASRAPTWADVMDAAVRPIWIEGEYQHPQYVEVEIEAARPTPVPPTATPIPTATPTPTRRQPGTAPTPVIHRVPNIRVPEIFPPAPSPTPTASPTPTPAPRATAFPVRPSRDAGASPGHEGQINCEYAETTLWIDLYGTDNVLQFAPAPDQNGHVGKHILRDRLKDYIAYLTPGDRAEVYIYGERNELLIPHDLSLCVYYEDRGSGNRVRIEE